VRVVLYSVFSQESPSPEPTVDVTESVSESVSNIVDVNWWLDSVLPAAIRIVLIIVILLIVRQASNRAIRRAFNRRAEKAQQVQAADGQEAIAAKRKAQRAHTLSSLFQNIVTILVLTTMVLMVLAQLGFNLGPLIAGAGIAGVAIGFGAQSLVADFLSGIFILMEDQYGVGDVVDVGDATGTVEEVQLRTTQLRAVDGSLWFVRNGEIMRVGNMSQDWSRGILDIGIAYAADIPKAKQAMSEVGQAFMTDPDFLGQVLETPQVWGVQELAADSVVIRMVVTTKPGAQFAVERALRERIKVKFDEEGIEIPFQQRTIWIRQDPGSEMGQSGTNLAQGDG